jgi:tetratricopeptide (TPR) repeat protein
VRATAAGHGHLQLHASGADEAQDVNRGASAVVATLSLAAAGWNGGGSSSLQSKPERSVNKHPPEESAIPAEAGEAATTPAIRPGVTVTGKPPHDERPLPKLPPNEFLDCLKEVGADNPLHFDYIQAAICERKLNWEKRIVIHACFNRSGVYVCLRQHDYESAIRDEAEAIRLDPKLAGAYFLRGVAFGDLGDSRNASIDIKTAVGLDPSLARYVTIKGKTASLTLPP